MTVLRDIRLGDIKAEAIPAGRVPVEDYLGTCLPGINIEHIHATDLPGAIVPESPHGIPPTSLFYHTVHTCFSEHYPLALRPEVLWGLILNEIATCVKLNPDTYRDLFTTAKDLTEIHIQNDMLVRGDPGSPWHLVASQFEEALHELIPDKSLMRDMLPPFTTETTVTRAASMVAFMAAASPFYDFHTHTMCGIPKIRLLGSSEDYDRLLSGAKALAPRFKAHLGSYFDHLIPVLTKLVKQAAGAPIDKTFWESIYKFRSGSGSDTFNGWISAFINYIQEPEMAGEYGDEATGAGHLVPKNETAYDTLNMPKSSRWYMPGIDLGSVPTGIYTCPFKWHYLEGMRHPDSGVYEMLFTGGVLSVSVENGYLTPGLSFGVAQRNETA